MITTRGSRRSEVHHPTGRYQDGLLDYDDVVVVAARFAYPEYLENGVYICQPGRSFKDGITHMGFYADGAIQREIARIVRRVDNLIFNEDTIQTLSASSDPIENQIAHEITRCLDSGTRQEGLPQQIFVLSGKDAAETVLIDAPILNDTTDKSGRPCAWTFGQRYTRLTSLTAHPTTTSQLQ